MQIRQAMFAALLLLAPGAALAQETEAPAQPPGVPKTLCFRSRPAAWCRAFVLTEVGYNSSQYGPRRTTDYPLQYEAGAMLNVNERDAVGGTIVFDGPHGEHWGATARFRRWITYGMALDVSPGFLVVDDHRGRRARLTADVSLSLGGWIAAFAHGESDEDGGRAGVGAKLGQLPGVLLGTGLYLLESIVPTT
jgi:hypothetical protein